jgi:transposase
MSYEQGPTASFRRRCHAVLLKSEGRTSAAVGVILKMNQVTVNTWLSRYEQQGINGLKTQKGQGRKQILDIESDASSVRKAVEQDRQRLSHAKAILEQELNKQFSVKTLKRFLKNLSADGKESG